jgi:hypothetical protein
VRFQFGKKAMDRNGFNPPRSDGFYPLILFLSEENAPPDIHPAFPSAGPTLGLPDRPARRQSRPRPMNPSRLLVILLVQFSLVLVHVAATPSGGALAGERIV